MRNFIVCFAVASVLAVANAAADPTPSAAGSTTPAAAPMQAPVSAGDPNRMVCRTMGAKTGSRIGASRQCRTQREWDDIRQQSQHSIEKMQARDAMAPR